MKMEYRKKYVSFIKQIKAPYDEFIAQCLLSNPNGHNIVNKSHCHNPPAQLTCKNPECLQIRIDSGRKGGAKCITLCCQCTFQNVYGSNSVCNDCIENGRHYGIVEVLFSKYS